MSKKKKKKYKKFSNELLIHVMHGYDTLQSPDGTDCFGCYVKGEHEIWVADNIPEYAFMHTIAHEYMHYLQDIHEQEFDEQEAEAFADSIFMDEEHDNQVIDKFIKRLRENLDTSTISCKNESELDLVVTIRGKIGRAVEDARTTWQQVAFELD